VDRVGYDTGLAAGERLGLMAQVLDRHGQQRHGDALSGRQQHVELASRGDRGHLPGKIDQLVRRVAHRRYHDDHLMAGLLGIHDPLGDPLDAFGIGYGGASVLLHDKAHVRSSISSLPLSDQFNERPHDDPLISHGEMSRSLSDQWTPFTAARWGSMPPTAWTTPNVAHVTPTGVSPDGDRAREEGPGAARVVSSAAPGSRDFSLFCPRMPRLP
jgi:hypothetical protein